MLSIFSVPKPFRGHIGLIQRNAIQSWTKLTPNPEVLLIGEEEGLARAAEDLGVRHVPEVARNEYNTPLVDSIFETAERVATHETLCYVNADILFLGDFPAAVERALEAKPDALVVGHRWDLDLRKRLDFATDWEAAVRRLVEGQGRLHAATGLDFFAFRKGFWGSLPPLALGRTVWDGWLIYRARELKRPVVDITGAATVVHQNHDYSHGPGSKKAIWEGPEARRNQELAGGFGHVYTLQDAQYELTRAGVRRRRLTRHAIKRSLERTAEAHRSLGGLLRFAGRARRIARPRKGDAP